MRTDSTRWRLLVALIAGAALSCLLVACGGAGKGRSTRATSTTVPGATTAPTNAGSVSSISGYQTANKPEHGISYRTHQIGPFQNDGDQDLVGDEDGDNRGDLDGDPVWDYKPEIDENGYYHDADDAQTASYGHAAGTAEAQAVTVIVKRYFAAASRHDGVLACRLLDPGLALAVPSDYGRLGPSYLRGAMSCQAVLDRLFRRSAKVLSAPVTVTAVRVDGDHALAMLASPKMPAGYAALLRKSGHWGMEQLLASTLT